MQRMPTRGAADEDQEVVRLVQLPSLPELFSHCSGCWRRQGKELHQLCKKGATDQWRASVPEQELQTQMDRGEAAGPREAAALLPAMPAQLMYRDGWINPIRFAINNHGAAKRGAACQLTSLHVKHLQLNLCCCARKTSLVTGLCCAVQIFMVVPYTAASIRLKLQLCNLVQSSFIYDS